MTGATELRLETARGRIAGLAWRASSGPPVLCLHGWLDNAASFIPISGFLPELDIIALDFPGHGKSDHRHPGARYYFIDYLWDLDAALDALGWSSCHLVGHSLGGAVASMYAAAASERVRSLTTIDALGPVTGQPDTAGERLRRSLKSVQSESRLRKAYHSLEDMMKARQANSDLGDAATRLICERSAQQVNNHFEWSHDPELHWVSPLLMTEEQALDCLMQIQVPVLSLTAKPLARFLTPEKLEARLSAIPHGRHEFLQGTHHFHMEQPEQTASIIRSFILEHEHSPGKNS